MKKIKKIKIGIALATLVSITTLSLFFTNMGVVDANAQLVLAESKSLQTKINDPTLSLAVRQILTAHKRFVGNFLAYKIAAQSCAELFKFDPTTLSGEYKVYPNGNTSQPVLYQCDIVGGKLTASTNLGAVNLNISPLPGASFSNVVLSDRYFSNTGNAANLAGAIDGASISVSSAGITVSGWACEISVAAPVNLQIYAGGPAGVGSLIAATVANLPSTSADSTCKTSNHGFTAIIPFDVYPATRLGKPIYAYAVSINADGTSNLEITGSGNYNLPTGADLLAKNLIDVEWANLNGNQASSCAQIGRETSVDYGFGICASGERRPQVGTNFASISYTQGILGLASTGGNVSYAVTTTTRTGSPDSGNTTSSTAVYCYGDGRVRDNSRTDLTVAYLCGKKAPACSFGGKLYASGQTLTAYDTPIASAYRACVSAPITCQNGAWTGGAQFKYGSCSAYQPHERPG